MKIPVLHPEILPATAASRQVTDSEASNLLKGDDGQVDSPEVQAAVAAALAAKKKPLATVGDVIAAHLKDFKIGDE